MYTMRLDAHEQEKLVNLRVLYLSNNKVASWTEIDRLGALDKLEDLLLVGNPLYNEAKDGNTLSDYRIEVRPSRTRLCIGLPPSSHAHSLLLSLFSLNILQVIKRLPNLKKLDGIPVDVDERDAAKAAKG